MKISVKRYGVEPEIHTSLQSYEVDLENVTLLEVLTAIKTKQDSSLSFSSGCRSSICGSCSMRVNGKEVLACAYKPTDGDVVEPLKNMPVVRDLIVDVDHAHQFMKIAKNWSSTNTTNIRVTPEDEKRNELQSDCILCGACYSACPVYAVNENFIGPFALTRSWRYVNDVRENDVAEKIEVIQTDGIWDCTLCNECVPVCPQDIAPKQDIAMLRTKSGTMGYMDPSFSNSFGGNSFDSGLPDFGSF